MREDTFHPFLSFLDQILLAECLSKISKKFYGEKWHQSGWFDTLPSSLSLIKKCFKLHLTFKKVSHSYSWPYIIQNCLSIFHNNSFQMKFSIFVHCGELASINSTSRGAAAWRANATTALSWKLYCVIFFISVASLSSSIVTVVVDICRIR